MLASIMRRLLLILCALAGVLLLFPGRALAHNTLNESTPADGAVLEVAPQQLAWSFDKAVPLETLTVTLIDAAGARTELDGSTHGPGGDTEVVTPLPALPPGETTIRWRLVGPDGHPITDTVTFTISASVGTTTPVLSDLGAAPVTTAPATESTAPPAVSVPSVDVGASDYWSTPSAFRWLLRGLSYVAIMVAAGVALTQTFVWKQPGWSGARLLFERALCVVGVTAFLQLMIIASDIGGKPLWRAWPQISQAVESTDAGMAMMIRLVVVLASWVLLVHAPPAVPYLLNELLMMLSLVLLGTWSFAGHSNSMRWRFVGVPVDIVHHGAAAAWLGGLTIVGLVALPKLHLEEVGPVMHRFSRVASIAVALIVATGMVQAVRLVGGPGQLFDADHGKLLAVKLLVLGGMLFLADMNRRRVNTRLRSAGASARVDVEALRRGMLLELVIGLVIIGVTAAMVVSPPATSAAATVLTA